MKRLSPEAMYEHDKMLRLGRILRGILVHLEGLHDVAVDVVQCGGVSMRTIKRETAVSAVRVY